MHKTNEFKEKRVVITGASAGVGRATAFAFARAGAHVVLLARGQDGLDGTKRELEIEGFHAETFSIDVSDAQKVDKLVDVIENNLGPIDVWINNAMCSVFSPLNKITPAEYERVTSVTYLGQVYCTMAVLKRMYQRNQGTIILVGSALAYRGIPLQSAYCGAKHGVRGFFSSLRCELLHDKSNIHLSMVELPALNTPQFSWVENKLPCKPRPMGMVFQPEVAAKAIFFAAQHKRRELYVGWPTYETIIGNKIAPLLLEKYLAIKGYKGQQTAERSDPTSPNNVFQPVAGDHGMHGDFDTIAHRFSLFLWMSMHRNVISIAIGLLIILILYFIS